MSAPEIATHKRVIDMTPAERMALREALGLGLDYFAEHCLVVPKTVRNWEWGIETRTRLAFRCYIEELQLRMDEAAQA